MGSILRRVLASLSFRFLHPVLQRLDLVEVRFNALDGGQRNADEAFAAQTEALSDLRARVVSLQGELDRYAARIAALEESRTDDPGPAGRAERDRQLREIGDLLEDRRSPR